MKKPAYLLLAVLFTVICCSAAAQEVPPRTFAGQTLEVPENQLDLGEVYYAWSGQDSQLVLRSAAPLQNAVVVGSLMVGYLVVPFEMEEAESPILAGAFRLPTHSMRTGMDGLDNSLQGPALLNAAAHPEMTFEIVGFQDVERLPADGENTHFKGTLQVKAGVKGNIHELSFSTEVVVRPWVTIAPRDPVVGDLMTIRGNSVLRLSELGWKPPSPRLAPRVAEEIPVEFFLLLSNLSPDKPGDPQQDIEAHHKQLHFITLLRDLNDPDAAYDYGRKLMQAVWEDARQLDTLARNTLTAPNVEERDSAFALQAAQRAVALSEERNPSFLATLALSHHHAGDIGAAVDWQKKAVAQAESSGAHPRVVAQLKATLGNWSGEAGNSANQ